MYHDFLRTLADRTGGRAYTNTNEFASRVEQILRDTGTFYLLGFRPAVFREDGRFRRLQVRVKQPGTTVTARTRYLAPSPPNPSFRVPPAADTALAGLLPETGIPLALVAAPFALPERGDAAVVLTLGAGPPPPAHGTPLAGDHVDVRFRAFTPQGDARGTTAVAVTMSLDHSADDVAYEVLGRLDLPPGRYEVRASAASAAWASGSVYGYVDVPDFRAEPLSLSGVFLSAAPARTTAAAEIVAGLLPFPPTVRRTFSTTDRVVGLLRLYQGGAAPLAPVTVRMTVTTATNQVVFDRPLRIGSDEFDGRAYDYRFELPLTRLQPGAQLLTLEVTGPAALRRDVRFEVR